MNKEDKDLLLKDLCARVPFGVKFHYFSEFADGEDPEFDNTITVIDIADEQILDEDHEDYIPIRRIMPYLRPISSMTEEEEIEYEAIFAKPWYNSFYIDNSLNGIDWLNAHHFDYRGLIEKGLAIAVTEQNNPYKD